MEGFYPLPGYNFQKKNKEIELSLVDILHMVNYKDIPIMLLIFFHISLFSISMRFRNIKVIKYVSFATCLFEIVASGSVGKFGKENWKRIGFSKDYFDENGLFLFIFFVFPPLLNIIGLFNNTLRHYKEDIFKKEN